jgi:YidC/Oxa1 family membrane protein insertase
MDKKSILAIVIITVVILLLPTYYKWINGGQEQMYVPQQVPEQKETIATQAQPQQEQVQKPADPVVKNKETKPAFSDSLLNSVAVSDITIETPLVMAKLSNMGGGKFYYWHLKNYTTWQENQVKIIDEQINNGLSFSFLTNNGIHVDVNSFAFEPVMDYPDKISLSSGEEKRLEYSLNIGENKITKAITFYADHYHVDIELFIENSSSLLLNNEYQFGWINGLPSNEENRSEDYSYSEAYASMGEEIENYSLDSEEKAETSTLNGNTDWIAIRTKYFLTAIFPGQVKTKGVNFGGYGVKIGDVVERRYVAELNVSKADPSSDSYSVYMGPMDYSILSEYENGIDDLVMSHGWYERTFRAISLPIIALLKFFHSFIPNYGIVIILFSILVKIVVYPLTKKSYKSMKEMSKVQPLLAELKEKHKSDPQRLQKETMKLYKEHGINPLGGCLPMLLQLPLLGALFIVFRSTIQLRGAIFIPGWIDDLSRADTIFTLPFSLPMYGDQFNILPILMAGSMIIQSKMTMQDPKQKAMVYIMPIFMLLIFNQFPSGLNLYYTLFNVFTIIQQKFTDNKGTPQKA